MILKTKKFMQDQVIGKGVLGWIIGSPGTGKSAVAFTFAVSKIMEGWNVKWAKLFLSRDPSCLNCNDVLRK